MFVLAFALPLIQQIAKIHASGQACVKCIKKANSLIASSFFFFFFPTVFGMDLCSSSSKQMERSLSSHLVTVPVEKTNQMWFEVFPAKVTGSFLTCTCRILTSCQRWNIPPFPTMTHLWNCKIPPPDDTQIPGPLAWTWCLWHTCPLHVTLMCLTHHTSCVVLHITLEETS